MNAATDKMIQAADRLLEIIEKDIGNNCPSVHIDDGWRSAVKASCLKFISVSSDEFVGKVEEIIRTNDTVPFPISIPPDVATHVAISKAIRIACGDDSREILNHAGVYYLTYGVEIGG